MASYTPIEYTLLVMSPSECVIREARWPSGRASDSGARGRGFDPHSGRRVVSLSKRNERGSGRDQCP